MVQFYRQALLQRSQAFSAFSAYVWTVWVLALSKENTATVTHDYIMLFDELKLTTAVTTKRLAAVSSLFYRPSLEPTHDGCRATERQ